VIIIKSKSDYAPAPKSLKNVAVQAETAIKRIKNAVFAVIPHI